jgi:7,8-dihydropterin-6-yl-methyl-4-(beta-D-ribofuranosyl)aminobenzene 5'-phosphate synthase
LVVFTACSHAGVVNVLKDAKRMFPDKPIYAVFGGFHLSGPNEAIIDQTIEGLKEFDLKLIGAGHCTGWRAVAALNQAFGDQILAPTAVGKSYHL